ncbi:MAG: hypothetical protein NT075_21740, partial [Chloroflexi bacterium]|nr:hypothetical protein [Chloroflexota bacterium]
QALFDEQQPLPPDVQFFEERKTVGNLLWALLMGLGLLVIGLLGTCIGVFALIEPITSPGTTTVATSTSITPLVIGLLFLLGGGLLLGSLRQRQRIRRDQQAGKATRLGIYLTPDVLISHSDFDYTLIPRSEFRGLQGNTVHYVWNDQAKSYSLPSTWVNVTPQTMLAAITAWAADASAQS